ncbi:MAG: hypothetical protein P8X50_17895, partial [Maritimibacter sp.]
LREYGLTLPDVARLIESSSEDVAAYRATLEDERMGHVYEILNGIQYEVMAERYEELAAGLTDLSPQQDL